MSQALNGKQIKEAVAFALSGIEEGEGRFLQVSGLRVWHRGPKLLSVQLLLPNGQTSPVANATRYNVATLDYLAQGGDGFTALKAAPALTVNGNRVDELMFKAFAESPDAAVSQLGGDWGRRGGGERRRGAAAGGSRGRGLQRAPSGAAARERRSTRC